MIICVIYVVYNAEFRIKPTHRLCYTFCTVYDQLNVYSGIDITRVTSCMPFLWKRVHRFQTSNNTLQTVYTYCILKYIT
jgi:hypothetical protein